MAKETNFDGIELNPTQKAIFKFRAWANECDKMTIETEELDLDKMAKELRKEADKLEKKLDAETPEPDKKVKKK